MASVRLRPETRSLGSVMPSVSLNGMAARASRGLPMSRPLTARPGLSSEPATYDSASPRPDMPTSRKTQLEIHGARGSLDHIEVLEPRRLAGMGGVRHEAARL